MWKDAGRFLSGYVQNAGMGEYKRPPISPETKELIDDVKPDGVSYDYWFRNDPRLNQR